ncbi:zliS Lysozyme family protein [uncultured Caudovirales phage]|uniref:ZliS Lysozyme family protein n=1 Tax=uncultured Caudovirales phage TaxID=2100421 RepID=A0A6J5M8B0_9CAUD|nr:zliS Lysozyme family protein [uncultured Caudovirales phage]
MTRKAIFDAVRAARGGAAFNVTEVAVLDDCLDRLKVPREGATVSKTETVGDATADRFAVCLPRILKHEGGYVNHPKDPGGATNKGIIQRTYDSWRDRQGQPRQSVKAITPAEVAAIYRRDYWDAVKGDDLPTGVDYAVFDFAVNSGINRAAKFLQRAVGVADDGVIGPATLAAVAKADASDTVAKICDARLAWLQTLPHWPTFGRGWGSRVADVRKTGMGEAK